MNTQDANIQMRVAAALLGKGVLVDKVKAPLFLRLIGRPHIEIVFRYPSIKTLIEYSEKVAQITLPVEELHTIKLSDPKHLTSGNAILAIEAIIVAAKLKVPFWTPRRLAMYLAAHLDAWRFEQGWKMYLEHSGAQDFINTIRSMMEVNNLSPMNQRSQPAQ